MCILPRNPSARSVSGAAVRQVAGFGVRPAEIGEKPPVLAVVRGMAFADRDARRIVVGAAGECVEAISAEQGGKHQRVARKFLKMLFGAGQRILGAAFHSRCEHFDVLAFAF